MSPISLAVMIVGAVLGLAFGLLRIPRGSSESQAERDLRLRQEDLMRQRDEIYARLRGLEDPELNDADRAALEKRAALTLRDLDQVTAERDKLAPSREDDKPDEKSRPPGTGTSFTARHPLLSGFLLGAGMVGLVGFLIYAAQRDAQPAPPEMVSGGPAVGDSAQGAPPGAQELPPELAARVEELRTSMTGGEGDIDVRERIAELLLTQGFFVQAFQEAQDILALDENSTEALYTQGVVRFMMGQPEEAIRNLDQALETNPQFSQASLMKGVFLLRLGDRNGAITSWQRSLDAVGGQDARLEHMLKLAEQGLSADEILSAPPPSP